MSVRRSAFARVSRGTATLSAVALLMGAGFMTPANAAEGVPFDPEIEVSVAPNSQLGELVPLTVTLSAAEGEEWTDVGTEKAPLTVRIEAYGEYDNAPTESPLPPVGEVAANTQTFPVTGGPGEYNFVLNGFDYNTGNYTFVVSVLNVDGSNSSYITSEERTAFGAPQGTTNVAFTPRVFGQNNNTEAIVVGDSVTAVLQTSGFNGEALDITSTLYGPFATAPTESATVPDGAPVVGTTLNTTSAAMTSTGAETVNAPGFYVWHHTIAAGPNSPAFTPNFAEATSVFEVTGEPVDAPPVVTPPVDGGTVTPPADGGNVVPGTPGGVVPGAPNGATVGGGTINLSGTFANCTEARAAGQENIPSDSPDYSSDLDSDKDGVGCESNGQDAAVGIDGGFAQASAADNTPFIAGGAALILLAFAGAATALVRRNK